MKKNNVVKNIMFHIRYPYTAAIIAIMWMGIAIISLNQKGVNFEALIILTSLCTLFIAILGFRGTN